MVCYEEYGDDATVHRVNEHVAVVENIDVFTPIHDDPHTQGEIVACNATNDVFAMGVTNIISLQAFMAYPSDIPQDIPAGVLRGMCDFMESLGSRVTGGQTIKNPIPVFGGVCLGVAHPDEIIYSSGAKIGDIILLTKPLGIQPAMRSYRDLQNEKRDALLQQFNEDELRKMQEVAVRIMTTSNLEVAETMRRVGAHAATDVTGFGILGHASNVAFLSKVDVVINTLPIIAGTGRLAEFFGHRLLQGYGAETAGGMLVFLSPERVDEFKESLRERGFPCWTVGSVMRSSASPTARLVDDVKVIETEFP